MMEETHHVPLGEEEVCSDIFEEMSEAFLQPDVLPPHRRHQVPEPLQDTAWVSLLLHANRRVLASLISILAYPQYKMMPSAAKKREYVSVGISK